MARRVGTTEAILKALAELGPMTRAEICRELGSSAVNVSALVSNLTRDLPNTPRRAHIREWIYDMEGQRPYPRAVYALGDKPNAKKPRPKKRTEVVNSYRARRKAKYRNSSVFNLASNITCNALSAASRSTASQNRAGQNRAFGGGESVFTVTTTG